jgi:hypothetical protein
MALVVVGSVKSRPGATTAALGLAAVLPPRVRPVVVECDAAGGDLAARRGLTVSPGLVELATASRSTGPRAGAGGEVAGVDVLSRVVRRVRVGDREVEVVVAPAGGAQTRVALSVLARPGSSALVDPGRVVVADCGRLDFASPARPLLGVADVVLVLTRGRLDELAHLREHAPVLTAASRGRAVVVLASGGVYGGQDVAEVLAADGVTVPVRGPLPYDERSAAVIDGRRVAGRRWRRWPLFAALERLAADLSDVDPPAVLLPAADADVEVR